MTYVFCNVIETHCLRKVVGTKMGGPSKPFIPHMMLAQTCYKKRVDLLDLSSPTCCWHKFVKNYQKLLFGLCKWPKVFIVKGKN